MFAYNRNIEMGAFVVVLLGILLATLGYMAKFPKRKLAPGPWNIPFYSGIFKIAPDAHVTFREWAKNYGPIIRTRIKLKETIIIDDIELIREAFTNPAVNGRPDDMVFNVVSKGKHGITFGDGEQWAEQRRFVIRTLRDLGFGKMSMESLVINEVEVFLDWMKKNEGIPIEINRRFALANVTPLWTLLAGERQRQDIQNLYEIHEKANQAINGVTEVTGLVTSLLPILVKILPKRFLKNWYEYVNNRKAFEKLITEAIEWHIRNPAPRDYHRDLIDVYLSEIENTTDPLSSFYKDAGRSNLEVVVNNIYAAANSTTPSLLTWTVLYLVRYPETQEKLYRELISVIGKNRLPSITDKASLPYTAAFEREVFRFASIVPLGLSHETTEDIQLGGYDIKKGTIVMPNLWSMNNSEALWGDPQNFRPERFLSTDGRTVLKIKDSINFGVGKRSCPGETLGRQSYFLFLTSMIQRFKILPDLANPKPSLDGTCGLFRDAKKFNVIARERSL